MNFFRRQSRRQPATAQPEPPPPAIQPAPPPPPPARAVPFVEQAVFSEPGLRDFYGRVMVGPTTLARAASSPATLRQVLDITARLEPDDYLRFLAAYVQDGLQRYGETWHYADITTVLAAICQLIQPRNYLEIGVRRGRSLAIVGALCPQCDIIGFDLWVPNYSDMANPGAGFVKDELRRLGHTGPLELVSGDSHQTVPEYLRAHEDAYFDAITIDGDHSEAGSEQDLRDTLERLKIGGAIIFDDICSPIHPYLGQVWQRVIRADRRFASYEYTDLGYGVAFAIRQTQ